ncbi:hypothetical protein WA026_000549 [Henosepilachna vigintioctopunctata]|uniref:Ubiquitin carboxyl-terminal hydrolase n=1 Tax=Henosepilachna vigintioctopunctata TaxID=420089 RepID=A0AAW1V7L3_9CUCU
MCDNLRTMGIDSNTLGKEKTYKSESLSANEIPNLKRTFTLPRIPFRSERLSKRKYLNKEDDEVISSNDKDRNKKVFRRSSIRRFINKIAQHINGANVINSENNRVPSVGLQTWGPDDTPGVTGLINHGNTCFINAVLQCIAHTDVLAEYFVLDRYKIDLSKRNKLNSKKFGSKGELTEQLAVLLKALWACKYDPELTIAFKQVVEKYGSQYKGRQQHDALEFLQWLLDKIHEDLNTASKKRFKSVKTCGRPDEVIAAETLENYKRCNNSFIQRVFQAQYKSSLSCSRCNIQSNTFDPFQCISVQLPQVSKQSVYVTVVYKNQQPRQVKIGLSIHSGGTLSELRDILISDTSIERSDMLLLEIENNRFHRTFSDSQMLASISEVDPIYCIEVPKLKDIAEDTTSAYVLLCWINCVEENGSLKRFGSPYCMQVSRETSYEDLQKLILKEMASILHDDVLTCSQPKTIYKIRIPDPACDESEAPCYLESELEHPLFMEALDQALALCNEDAGPPHVKLVLEWDEQAKQNIIADDTDIVEEHFSVMHLRTHDLQGAPLTLEECLRDYTEAETLTDAWRCPQCQQYQPVIKTLGVWSLPDILIVHFKRFRQQCMRGTNTTKLTTMVEFPVCEFDMSPHLAHKFSSENNIVNHEQALLSNNWSPWKKGHKSSTSNDNIYDLYAVCYHHGTSLGTGHYTAACKNPYDSQWYLYDDVKVVNLSKQSDDISSLLVNNNAYILFYQRRGGFCSNTISNSSSAASTSSGGSANDHWISKMPKFLPPKHLRSDKKTCTESNNKIQTTEKVNGDVSVRNNQNTLKSTSQNSISPLVDGTTSEVEVKVDCPQLKNTLTISDDEVKDPELKSLNTTNIHISLHGEANTESNDSTQDSIPISQNSDPQSLTNKIHIDHESSNENINKNNPT